MHYFECRERLRADHFRIWIAFLNFVSDLYTNIGYVYEGIFMNLLWIYYNLFQRFFKKFLIKKGSSKTIIFYLEISGELVDLVFQIFDYMLKAPVLDTLKIEEVCILSYCSTNVESILLRRIYLFIWIFMD